MTTEILLALAASLFTATSSVAQRIAAAPAAAELSFSWRLVTFLLKRPVWFLGILCMILGFAFQLAALHVGDLSLVQPVIASELLFVFAYLALRNRHLVHLRDWAAAVGMAVSLGAFLLLASPGGGVEHTSGWVWVLAGIATFGAAAVVSVVAVLPARRGRIPNPVRRAGLLAIAAGIAWGFVAAVIKELSTHLNAGPGAVFSNWSPYVLLLTGAAAMFLASNAFQAGPLAASQPGLTIMDPLVASLLGITVFSEHIRHSPLDLTGEALALAVLIGSVVLLSRSPLIRYHVVDAGVGAVAPVSTATPAEAPGAFPTAAPPVTIAALTAPPATAPPATAPPATAPPATAPPAIAPPVPTPTGPLSPDHHRSHLLSFRHFFEAIAGARKRGQHAT